MASSEHEVVVPPGAAPLIDFGSAESGLRELPGSLKGRDERDRSRGWLVHRLLLVADVLGLVLAFAIAYQVFGKPGDWPEAIVFFATLPIWVIAAKLYGLYDRDEERTSHSTVDDLVRVFHLVTVVSWLLIAADVVTGVINPNLPKVALFWAVAIAFVVALRGMARTIASRSELYVQRAIVVGAGDVGQLIARKLLRHPEYRIEVLGFVDETPKEREEGLGDLGILGSIDDLPGLVDRYDVDRVIVAFSNESHEAYLHLLRRMKEFDVHVDVVPRLFEMLGSRAHLHSVEGIPVVGLPPLRLSRSWRFMKRLMDVAFAALGIVVLFPLLIAIAVAIKTTTKGPIFFRQVRMGHRGEPFEIVKFRTMVVDAEAMKSTLSHLNMHLGGDERMFKIPDDPRLTGVGRVLRRWALDELPQLFNVLRGDMSLVGPRPLILEEDSFVQTWGRRRLDLKPGITGPWQALGGSTIPFEEMVRLDYLYITNWSLYEDVKWLWKTIPGLISGRHAY